MRSFTLIGSKIVALPSAPAELYNRVRVSLVWQIYSGESSLGAFLYSFILCVCIDIGLPSWQLANTLKIFYSFVVILFYCLVIVSSGMFV